eukprot:GILI01035443.1.p2 GENE.GILI01035443.1~~GILI01035443.1.p2  ORF type:complete len:143 (+),score=36.02 GILI01035443.1:90-518(+)
MKAALLLILALFACSAWAQAQVKVCSQAGDYGQIQNVSLAPNPPVKGQQVSINLSVKPTQQITGGTVDISVKYAGIKLHDEKQDLCSHMSGASCPVAPGTTFAFAYSVSIPSFAPGGNYAVTLTTTDSNGAEVDCVELDFTL